MIAFLVFLAIAVVMAIRDPHPVTAGKSQSLLTPAQYPKVYVHFVGGVALAAFLDPFLVHDFWLLIAVAVIGAVYEAVQWVNVRGRNSRIAHPELRTERGVFTLAEAIAVAAGALVLIVVKYLPAWF